jgi:hypothetical protein
MARRRNVPMPPWSSIEAQSSKPAGRPNPVFHEPIEIPASRAASRPRDPQGLPFLTSGDVARDLGITNPLNYKHAAYGVVPHYVDTKSGELKETSNNRVWFAMQDIVNHFAIKSGAGKAPESKSASELAHTPKYNHWKSVHENALKVEQENKKSGINNGHLWDQPDINNRDIHRRMLYGTRTQHEDDPATGDLVGRVIGTGSNLANPTKFGNMRPVGEGPGRTVDYSDPRRPRER